MRFENPERRLTMKTLADLEAIRKQMLDKVTMRKEDENGVRVVVGMATCGIAAGARPVMTAFLEEAAKRNLEHVTVTQTGCIGMCRLEPIVEVFEPNKEKVTYVKMTPEKAVRVVAEHIVNGNPVTEYTIGAVEG
jgi:NADP-reducing hydrogenase subunit HndB